MLQFLDWFIISLFFAISLGIGIYMSKKASADTGAFFLGGRKLPWYIAGTSMVATTFAADTPLAVTELVAENGIAGNWLWWNMLFGGMLTVFFFAKLWRRAGIMTDCEFVTIRYSGKPANFLRGFRAFYIGIFMNVIVIAWVNLAMLKILSVLFPDFTILGHSEFHVLGNTVSAHIFMVAGLMLLTAIYSALSGLMGVSLTDAFQFVMAMTGCIILAIFALDAPEVGGIAGLKEKLPEWVFSFTPSVGSGKAEQTGLLQMSVTAFVAYLGVQWWSSWYPGAEPGGGGYIAQRMMSAKDEKHSLFATLWFNIAHFAIRPWPWVIVALCSLILYPDLPADAKGEGFVLIIKDLLPSGLLGLLIAAFIAAYMSTLASQTIWGTSYIINDFYKPFVKKDSSEKELVKVSRITAVILIFFSLLVTTQLSKISDAWKFILECSAGIGLVLILRWYWWRINAWSEISALLAPFIIYPVIKYYDIAFPNSMLYIVAWSTAVWIIATYSTKPESDAKLSKFYKKIRPGGIGWKYLANKHPEIIQDNGYGILFLNWIISSLLILSLLIGSGKLIFNNLTTNDFLLVLFPLLSIALLFKLNK